jgi:hypothetical protein
VYDVRVKANCGDESSEWTEGQFEVGCLNGVVVMVDSTITIGTGTSTSTAYLFPGLWGWQYAAHLYDDITPGLLKDIAFYLNASSTTTGSSMKMWVKLVDAGYTMTASNTFASLVQGAREIYDGTPDFSTAGWIHFPISGNLNIPEGKSLLVLVRGIGCSVSGGCSKAYRYTSATNKVWYKNVDNADPGQEIAGTLTSYRANIQMTYSMPSVDCNDQLACETPASVTITNITTDAATVVWTGNADSYVLEYKTGENDWTAVTINDTTYTFSNLDQKTTYTVRVKAVCGENNNSLYTDEVAFTTTSVCPVVTDINTSNLSTTTTISWTPGGNETAWTLRFRPVGTTEWVTLNISGIPSTTFGGLLDQTDYEVEIMALCDPNDEDNQSSWAPYLFTSGCAAFEK